MHIFVINLREDFARREAIENQLRNLGLSHEFFPAIHGKNLSLEERKQHCDEAWFIRNEGRPALPGQLGCALSHIAIYQLIRAKKLTHALILEDDAWLNPNLPQLLQAIAQKYAPNERNIFLLTWFIDISMRTFETLWSHYHVAKVKSAVGSHGYVISNAAAEALIQTLYPVRHFADSWGWLQRHRIVNIFAIFPPCITADLSYKSRIAATTIEPEGSALKRMKHKAYRGFWRAIDHVVAIIQRSGERS